MGAIERGQVIRAVIVIVLVIINLVISSILHDQNSNHSSTTRHGNYPRPTALHVESS